jgi:mannose-6-phosphate isomerase-like protein (cupin superfamily)
VSENQSGETAHLSVAQAVERVAAATPLRSVSLFEHGTLLVKFYAPRGEDPQKPHARDELYVVAQGRGVFFDGQTRRPFGPGDLLCAAAGVPHRFEAFTDDFGVWVMYYGPGNGEAAVPRG